VLAAAYPVLFPHPLARELYLRPVWSLDLDAALAASSAGAAGTETAGISWFRVGDRFGYIDLDGGIRYQGKVLAGVCLSESGFINYSKISDNIVFSDPQGRFRYGFASCGYPILDREGGRLFTVSTDSSGIRQVSPEGETIWRMEFSSPMTTVALSTERLLIGLLEGRFKLIDSRGGVEYEAATEGSRIPVVLGSALSPRRERAAVLSGIDPQHLLVLEKRESGFGSVYSRDLPSDLRREAMLQFSPDGRFLLFEQPDAVGVLDVDQKREYRVLQPGRLGAIALDSPAGQPSAAGTAAPADAIAPTGTVAILSRLPDVAGREQRLLQIVRLPHHLLASERIAARADFVRQVDGRLLVGLDGYLLRVDIRED
jgi:hypothetical protein